MAASVLKAPGYLYLNGNLSQNFRDWHRSYQIYAIASGVSEKSQKIQCNVFLHVAGPAAQKVFSTWTIPDDEKDKTELLITRFKIYSEGKRNITVIRYNFKTRNQRPGEGFESHYTELKNTVKDCEFGSLEDNLLRDRLVCGIIDEILREKLLQVEDLTLEKCVNMCRLLESSARQLKTLGSSQPEPDVHALRKNEVIRQVWSKAHKWQTSPS